MSLEIIQKSLDQLADVYQTGISKLKQQNETLEQRIDAMQAAKATSYGASSNKEVSLKSDVLNAAQENTDGIAKFIKGEAKHFQFEVKDMSLANYTGTQVALQNAPLGIVGATTRSMHVRDVLNKVQMSTQTLPIIKDNGNVGNFATVAEGATKPTVDFSLEEVGAKAQVIAGIARVTKQFLDDLGPQGVTSWLTNRLTELYLNAEDTQLLTGNGVSPNILGLNAAGQFTAATAAETVVDVEQLVLAMIQMRTLQRVPRAILIHPTDLSLILQKAAGSGEYDLPSVVSLNAAGGLAIMGVPVIDTVAQTVDKFNILDTSQMILGVRDNLKIEFFDQAGDNVQTNKITIRAEARIAFASYGAVNNIYGDFGKVV